MREEHLHYLFVSICDGLMQRGPALMSTNVGISA